MDALMFFRELNRMCRFYKGCDGCPFVMRSVVLQSLEKRQMRLLNMLRVGAKPTRRKPDWMILKRNIQMQRFVLMDNQRCVV